MRDGGTMSEFVWLDYSERERRKMLDVVDLFGEHDTRDELCPIPANHESRFRTPRIPVQFPGQAPTEAANLPCLRSSSGRDCARHNHRRFRGPSDVSAPASPTSRGAGNR